MANRIVITGGPGSAKTEFLERLKSDHDFSEFTFFDELARKLLESEPRYRTDFHALHLAIYEQQVARENAIGDAPFITDRGTVDAFAFHPETMVLVNTNLEREYRRYTAVIQLGSAANLGEDVYCTDDIRQESVEEALQIERAIRKVWEHHPGYAYIPADPNLENKFNLFRCKIIAFLSTT